jgi:hypothetical protein
LEAAASDIWYGSASSLTVRSRVGEAAEHVAARRVRQRLEHRVHLRQLLNPTAPADVQRFG